MKKWSSVSSGKYRLWRCSFRIYFEAPFWAFFQIMRDKLLF